MKKKRYVTQGSPGWLQTALVKAQLIPDRWSRTGYMDHCAVYKRKVAIFQPYEIVGSEFRPFLEMVEKTRLQVVISGMSPYFPGRTVAIIVWRNKDAALAAELIQLCSEHTPSDAPIDAYEQWL